MAKQLSSSVTMNTNATKKRAPRAKKPSAEMKLEMTAAVELDTRGATGDSELNALLADLMVETPPSSAIESPTSVSANADEVLLDAAGDAEAMVLGDAGDTVDDATLAAAVIAAEAADHAIAVATVPDADDASAPTPVEAESKKGGKKAARTVTPRKHYSDKIERLKDRMGPALAEYSVLTAADVADADMTTVMERTMEIMRSMNSKEKNRASNFIEWLSGKRSSLNVVSHRLLGVLEKDGYLQTGNEGNAFQNLLARPFSPSSARAMGGNTIGMLADLKVLLPLEGHRGRFVANPESLLLAKARTMLAAPAPAAAGGDAEEGADE